MHRRRRVRHSCNVAVPGAAPRTRRRRVVRVRLRRVLGGAALDAGGLVARAENAA